MVLRMLVLVVMVVPCLGSWGDSSSYHQGCLRHCRESWGNDCTYTCMWDTVAVMESRHGQVSNQPNTRGGNC